MIKNPNKHNKENMTVADKLQLGDLVWVAVNRSHQIPVAQTTFVLCAITYIPYNIHLGEVWRLWGNGQEYLEYYWNICTTYNLLLMEHPEGLSMLGLPRDYWMPLFRRQQESRHEIGGSSSDELQGKR